MIIFTIWLYHSPVVVQNNKQSFIFPRGSKINLLVSYFKYQPKLLFNELALPEKNNLTIIRLSYSTALETIKTLKLNLAKRSESITLFDNERDHGLENI